MTTSDPVWRRGSSAPCDLHVKSNRGLNIAVPALLLLLVTAGLLLTGCQSNSYERGYEEGYTTGYSKGEEAGYRRGYEDGYFSARPPGDVMSESSARLVTFGATLGAVGLLIGLGYCACVMVAADISADIAAAKAGASAFALMLAAISTVLLGAHRFADPLLLLPRPGSPVVLTLLVLLFSAPAFVTIAWIRSIIRRSWGTRQQTTITASFVFAFFFALAVEIALMKAPQGERYLFCYLGLGVLLGMIAHAAFRLTRKAEGF
jgi:hypothetical protein